MNPHQLERYSFIWSEVRLVIAAIALFLGGVPPALLIIPLPLTGALLTLCWVVSGLASLYLLYRWWSGGQRLFGKKEAFDSAAFAVSVVSGLNLGWTGITGNNIGMSISSNHVVFIVAGLVYLAAALYLYSRWSSHSEKLFH